MFSIPSWMSVSSLHAPLPLQRELQPHQMSDFMRNITAGATAALTEMLLLHPLDVVKTRLQAPGATESTFSCLAQTVKLEGVRALYKGLIPAMLAETPKRAARFYTFDLYKNVLGDTALSPFWTLALAGLGSGMSEAVVVNPFEVVKVRQQIDRTVGGVQKTAISTMKEILLEKGPGGLMHGVTSTMMRNGTFNLVYFTVYYDMKRFIPDQKESYYANLFSRIGLGFVGASIASALNIPMDVAKSRIQGIQTSGQVYKGCVSSMLRIGREEGWRVLYSGLPAKILRLGPGGAIMLVVYEEVYDMLG